MKPTLNADSEPRDLRIAFDKLQEQQLNILLYDSEKEYVYSCLKGNGWASDEKCDVDYVHFILQNIANRRYAPALSSQDLSSGIKCFEELRSSVWSHISSLHTLIHQAIGDDKLLLEGLNKIKSELDASFDKGLGFLNVSFEPLDD